MWRGTSPDCVASVSSPEENVVDATDIHEVQKVGGTPGGGAFQMTWAALRRCLRLGLWVAIPRASLSHRPLNNLLMEPHPNY